LPRFCRAESCSLPLAHEPVSCFAVRDVQYRLAPPTSQGETQGGGGRGVEPRVWVFPRVAERFSIEQSLPDRLGGGFMSLPLQVFARTSRSILNAYSLVETRICPILTDSVLDVSEIAALSFVH
jgi:hypothetical protein